MTHFRITPTGLGRTLSQSLEKLSKALTNIDVRPSQNARKVNDFGLAELLPWLHQWHNEHDVSSGMNYAVYFQTFVEEEARNLGFTMEQINSFRYEPIPPLEGS